MGYFKIGGHRWHSHFTFDWSELVVVERRKSGHANDFGLSKKSAGSPRKEHIFSICDSKLETLLTATTHQLEKLVYTATPCLQDLFPNDRLRA